MKIVRNPAKLWLCWLETRSIWNRLVR